MSSHAVGWRSHPKGTVLSAALVVLTACATGVLSAAAVAGPTALAAEVTVRTNYTHSAEVGDEARRPKSSLRSRLRQMRAQRAMIEPAAAPAAERALSPPPAAVRALSPAPSEAEADDIPEPLTPEVRDPLEPVNRVVFGFNEVVDFVVFRPVSLVYRTVVPQPLRIGISNALDNWWSPVTFANDLLQGKPERARTTFVRFLVNSTAGFGGMVDAAQAAGLPRHSEDFGQTLGVWGAGPGPYLVLPLFGPSNFRDGVGLAVDTVTHPATWVMWDLSLIERVSPTLAYTVSGHEALLDEADALRRTSPDFYASVRDIYTQKRATDIADGADIEPLPPIPGE